jgi:hypothetical protein
MARHGYGHDWQIRGDVVTARRGKKNTPCEIRRHEKCAHCPRERFQTINLVTGAREGSMTYKGEVITYDDRKTTDEERREWVATTSPDDEIRMAVIG